MTSTQVLVVAIFTWLIWIPAALLQKRARGDTSGVSLFPVIPLFPLSAWLAAYAFNASALPLGATIVGGVHALLLVLMLFSTARSALTLRRLPKV